MITKEVLARAAQTYDFSRDYKNEEDYLKSWLKFPQEVRILAINAVEWMDRTNNSFNDFCKKMKIK